MAQKPQKKKNDDVLSVHIEGNVAHSTIIVGDNNTVISAGEDKNYARFLVPFPHNPDFVGRDEELSNLHEMLQQKQSIVGIRPTVLVGLGGIGKTQLAVEYAHAHRDDYPSGVFWLNAINPLLIEFSNLAEKLEMSDRDTPRDKAARKAWDYLDLHPDALVIFDNVLEPSELNLPFSPDLVPANLRCRTLFTTRQRDFPRTFQPFEVKVLPEMSAMRLLLRSRPEVLEEHNPEWGWARIVCAYLGWLPLALELAAAYLGAYPEVSITGYLERLRTEGSLETVDESEVRAVDLPTRVEEILKAAAAGNLELKHQIAVSATLQTQWKRLDNEDARLLFRAAGQFPEASWIPIPRLGLLTGIESEAKAAGRHSPLNVVLKKLHAVSLIEELSDDRLRLHPLVQEFAARLSPAPASFRLEMAERVATEFDDLLRLQARVIRYGVDMALEDVRTALGFCIEQKETNTYSRISKMERVLDRQAHGLRDWNAQEQPANFLAQIWQIRNETFAQDIKKWQAQAEAELTRLKKPYLIERFPIRSDSAELRTLLGHSDWINGVALSADGQLAISASHDNTLKVWDVPTGRELRTLVGHKNKVMSVALTPDGRLAVSASQDDNTFKVWDVTTGYELRTFQGDPDVVKSGDVTGIALSSNGRLAISVSHDISNTAKVWDVATGRELRRFDGHRNYMRGIVISADGQFSISASDDTTLKVWDVATGCELRTLIGHKNSVMSVALTPDGRLAVSASMDDTLKVWDVATGQELRTLIGHKDAVMSVALSVDGRLAISASRDDTLKVWDVETGHELCTLQAHTYRGIGVALSADGQTAVSISERALKIWPISSLLPSSSTLHMKTNQQIGANRVSTSTIRESCELGYKASINDVALSADGRLAVSASDDETLKVWNIVVGHEIRTIMCDDSVRIVALSANGQLAISLSSMLEVWDISTGKALHTLKGHFQNSNVNDVAMSADGSLAASVADYAEFIVWNVVTGRELRRLTGHGRIEYVEYYDKIIHDGDINGVKLSAIGRLAISASDDKTLKVWEVATGNVLCTLTGHNSAVTGVALSADGRLAVSISKDSIIKVWDIPIAFDTNVDTVHERYTFTKDNYHISDVALSLDGRLAVFASSDGTLKVWDIPAGCCIATLLVGSPLKCCAMSADGKTIVAGDEVGGVHFLELVGAGAIPEPYQEEVEARSHRLPRWLKGLLGRG